jgi:Ca2+-binding RTX toxin-like protein
VSCTESDGKTVITGTAGNDRIVGTNGPEVIRGGAGDDRIECGAGNDRVDGGAGNDTINCGAGNDVIHGDYALSSHRSSSAAAGTPGNDIRNHVCWTRAKRRRRLRFARSGVGPGKKRR